MKNFSETISEIRHSSPVLGIVIRIAIGLLICGVCHGQSVVNFAMTNRLTNLPDTNFFRVFSINDPVLAHGGIQTKGPATLVYPNTNGLASLTLLAGYYQMTNAYLGQGILFLVPGDTNSYNVNDLAISGYNTYQITGVRKATSTGNTITITPGNGVGIVNFEVAGGGGPGAFTAAGTNITAITNGNAVTVNGQTDTNVVNAMGHGILSGTIPFYPLNSQQTSIKVMSFGDSVAFQGGNHTLFDPISDALVADKGLNGNYCSSYKNTQLLALNGGATLLNPDVNWWQGYTALPPGGSVTYSNWQAFDFYSIGNLGQIFYLVGPSEGTFQINVSTNGAFFATLLTINANQAGSTFVVCTNFTLSQNQRVMVQCVGSSGTTHIIGESLALGPNSPGVAFANLSWNGANLSALRTIPRQSLDCFLTNISPDIVFYSMKELGDTDINSFSNNILWLDGVFTNDLPKASIIYLGPYCDATDDGPYSSSRTFESDTLQQLCFRLGRPFVNLEQLCSYNTATNLGIMADTTHMGLSGVTALASYVLSVIPKDNPYIPVQFITFFDSTNGIPRGILKTANGIQISQNVAGAGIGTLTLGFPGIPGGSLNNYWAATWTDAAHMDYHTANILGSPSVTQIQVPSTNGHILYYNWFNSSKFPNGIIGGWTTNGGFQIGNMSGNGALDDTIGQGGLNAEGLVNAGYYKPANPNGTLGGGLNVFGRMFGLESRPGVGAAQWTIGVATNLPNYWAMAYGTNLKSSAINLAGNGTDTVLLAPSPTGRILFENLNQGFPNGFMMTVGTNGGLYIGNGHGAGAAVDNVPFGSLTLDAVGTFPIVVGTSNFLQQAFITNLNSSGSGLLPSGGLTNAAGSRVAYLADIGGAASTNVISIAVNTNAVAVTNGLLVTISGVTDTNVVNILATNVAAYQSLIATQALGSAAWVSSNTFWLTSSNLAYQVTNGMTSGAFTPSNTVWLASSNLVYQGTNGLTSGAFTPSNTAWINSSNLAYQVTNGLTTGAFTSSNTAWINSSNLAYQVTNGLTTGAFTSSNTAWVNSSNLVYQGTNALASGAYTPSNTVWIAASNLVQQATNAVVKQIQGTNILSGGSTLGQVLTATATGAAWSNAPAGGGGGPGLPGTNTVVAYGDQYRTNAEAISSGGTVFSNAVGVVQIGSGGIWWTNLKSGNWGWITNDSSYFSNYVTGIATCISNGVVTLTNTTAAGIYAQYAISNATLSPGTAAAINLLAADGATQIGNWTNGGIWASNPISAPAYTNSGLLSADAVATDSGGKLIQATAISMNHIAQPLVVSSLPLPMGAFYTNNQASPASAIAFTNLSGAWAFTSGQTNTIRLLSAMPGDWYPGTVKFDLFAACTSTNAGQDGVGHTNMVFYVKGAAIKAGGDLSNPTFGTAVWCTNHVSTNSYVAGECITTAITIGNSPSTNTPILWEIGRLAASGNGDTMTNSQACLIDAKVWYQYVLTNALPASTP